METGFVCAIAAAIVLGVLFLGALVAVICLAVMWEPPSHQPKFHVFFDKYTAVTYTISADATRFIDSLTSGYYHILGTSQEHVFGPYKWYIDAVNDSDAVVSRSFSTKHDNTEIVCSHVGSHDNCFARSFNDYKSFEIPGSYEYVEENNCEVPKGFQSFMPNRIFDKCKVFAHSEVGGSIVYIVDSKTNFPIMKKTSVLEETGSYIMMAFYKSFEQGEPADESGLKPFPNVTIYDFRDGKGDAGDGESNVYVESSDSFKYDEQITEKKTNLNNDFLLFETIKQSNDKGNKLDQYMRVIRRNQAIRDYLGLPPMGIVGSQSLSVQNTASLRDIRDIPASFDAREHWSNCKSVIGTITNQNPCGGCWAMASSGVLADRRCIANSANKQQLSPQYMIYCSMRTMGCFLGGDPLPTWEFLATVGTVPETCVPFVAQDGVCTAKCENGDDINQGMLVKAGKIIVTPWGDNNETRVQAIQSEIMTNGPITASMWVFSDFDETYFMDNPKRIYHRSKEATWDGGHTVRLIGWGSEAGEDYWIVANSWGTGFADNGVFRIRRGNNECNFEEEVTAAAFA